MNRLWLGAPVCTVFGVLLAAAVSYSADLDRGALDFKTPAEIKWVRNAAGTNESFCSTTRASRGRTWCGSSGCPAT